MPSGGVLAAAAVAVAIYLAGVKVVHGVKRLGHGIKVGVTRLVHHHQPSSPALERRPADNAPK